MTTNPIPEGFPRLTPNLVVGNGVEALDFYQRAFGAEILRRFEMDGQVMHSDLRIGDAVFHVSDAFPDFGLAALTFGDPVPASFMLWTEDADALHAQAVAAGATELSPVSDAFSGQRMGSVRDPYGHRWAIATQIEDVSEEEVNRRMQDWAASSTT
jgi:PhnB protein